MKINRIDNFFRVRFVSDNVTFSLMSYSAADTLHRQLQYTIRYYIMGTDTQTDRHTINDSVQYIILLRYYIIIIIVSRRIRNGHAREPVLLIKRITRLFLRPSVCVEVSVTAIHFPSGFRDGRLERGGEIPI